MAERKFDYAQVAQNYKNMNAITGDAGTADSIAGIFDSINKEYEANVDVSEMAIFGDLGKQLLLDWKNTASNFPSFVDKFNSWSTVVVQSANDYSKFETEVKGFKEANPLGFASGGITQNHIESSTLNQYADANIQQHNQDAANLAALHALTPGEYERSDAQKALAIHKGVAGVTVAVDAAALALIGLKFSGGITPGSTPSGPGLPPPSDVPQLPASTSTGLSVVDDLATTAGKVAGKTGYYYGPNGEVVKSTVSKVGDTFQFTMEGSFGTRTGTLADFVNTFNTYYNSNLSAEVILRQLGFAI